MKKIIFTILLLLAFKVCAADKTFYYQIVLDINKKENSNVFGLAEDYQKKTASTDFYYELRDDQLNFVASGSVAKIEEGMMASGQNGLIMPDIAFNVKAAKIFIFDKNNKQVADLNVSKYQKCSNGVCDKYENYSICPMDCPSGGYDNYCDRMLDGICDVDCLGEKFNGDRDCNDLEKSKNKQGVLNFIQNQDVIIRQSINTTTVIATNSLSENHTHPNPPMVIGGNVSSSSPLGRGVGVGINSLRWPSEGWGVFTNKEFLIFISSLVIGFSTIIGGIWVYKKKGK